MEVILLERIARLGAMGDVVKVKNGFARNYLIPMKKALRASEESKKLFEERRHILEEQNAKSRAEAEKRAKTLDGMTLTMIRQASQEGKLYGSVAVRDVAEALEAAGHEVPRSQIVLSTTIKNTGDYIVRLPLHAEVTATVTVSVKRAETEETAE
jgi:large subunit ribosomal protein L9